MPVAPAASAASDNASLTDYVAGFIVATREDDIPADVARLGKRSVLDGIGLALAGAASQTGALARRYLATLGIASEGGNTVIGSDMRLPARFAAFANGISIHADDYDDTQLVIAKDRVYGLLTHPTAPALPPALALAERERKSGRELMTAYQVGVEVECKVAEAIMPRHYQHGFHMTLPGFEADRGFFRAAGGGYSAEMIDGKLGSPWTFAFPGVSIKPHPSGSLTHPGMRVMLDLIRRHDLRPERVKRVTVGTNHNMPNALIHHRPTNELQAKFSMEFCLAILLLEREAGLEQFTDDVVNRADVQALLRRVHFGVNAEAEAAGFDKMTTIIEVEQDDGTVVNGSADFGKGSPANPMSDDELTDKFRQCAAWGGLDAAQAKTVCDLVWRIETLADVGELTQHLRRTTSTHSGAS